MNKITLRMQVIETLSRDVPSRNSDIRLTQMVWYLFHEQKLFKRDGKLGVMLYQLQTLPREDNIKRIRAKIQNEEHKYLPTNPEIRAKRFISEQEWRAHLGYSNGDTL